MQHEFNSYSQNLQIKTKMSEEFPSQIFGEVIPPADGQDIHQQCNEKTFTNSKSSIYMRKSNFWKGSFQEQRVDYSSLIQSQKNNIVSNRWDCKNSNKTMSVTAASDQSVTEISTNLSTIRKLNDKDQLDCPICSGNNSIETCQMCEGRKKVLGGNNMAKFMEYVMEFKLGRVGSYGENQCINKTTMRQKRSVNRESENPYSVINKVIERGFKNSNIHIGFSCDSCQADPIKGNRYHCADEECQDDFDLCQQCFQRVGHIHKVNKISENGFRKCAETLSMIIAPKKRRQPFSPYQKMQKSQINTKTIFLGSKRLGKSGF